ncbi:hypothetical protein SD71_20400 [Cohnella kolymensis]|uniref:YcxB-like C-terminal domain-containing protein n=1 Tax=Cohnella kolymensis TaxID=1590652 RepID=A0ABR5A083_9BACL|nr:YcxB family protein [Cohnella kolymensis]KIL34386.1 hypothetical protein SD71_20400 [Cohnella kolymensis]
MKNSIIDLKFKYSEQEFKSAMIQSHGDTKRIAFDLLIVTLLFAYGIYLLANDQYGFFSSFMILVSLLYVFVIIARNYIVPVMLFRKEPKYRKEYFLSFSDDGIVFNAGSINANLDWDYYNGMKETKDFVMLTYGKRGQTIIPKRVFTDEQLKQFKQLVREKVIK